MCWQALIVGFTLGLMFSTNVVMLIRKIMIKRFERDFIEGMNKVYREYI